MFAVVFVFVFQGKKGEHIPGKDGRDGRDGRKGMEVGEKTAIFFSIVSIVVRDKKKTIGIFDLVASSPGVTPWSCAVRVELWDISPPSHQAPRSLFTRL